MSRCALSGLVCAWLLLSACLLPATGVAGETLERCIAQSPRLADVHACLDATLDRLDEQMQEYVDYVDSELSPEALVAFSRSQQSFRQFRRNNCLWYLTLVPQRREAEQVAKDCLVDQTRARLAELRTLVAPDTSAPLMPEPEPVLQPEPEPNDTPSDPLPSAGPTELAEEDQAEGGKSQPLIAYFGAWRATCQQSPTRSSCELRAAMVGESLNEVNLDDTGSELVVQVQAARRKGAPLLSTMEVSFGSIEIDSPERVYWQLDTSRLAEPARIEVLVDEQGSRLQLSENGYIQEQLLPRLRGGRTLFLSVLEPDRQLVQHRFEVSLVGISQAWQFVVGEIRSAAEP